MNEWAVLKSELQKHDLSESLIDEEFFFIGGWIEENFPIEAEIIEEEEALPDYTPGEKKEDFPEKIQSLEPTGKMMAINVPIESVATSSKAEPPPYTFEDGSDEAMDREFSQYIRRAIEIETSTRYLQHERYPLLGPHVHSWLPASVQAVYKDRIDVIPMMDANSFTAMAYETAPRYHEEIERWTHLLRASCDGQRSETSSRVIGEALRTLKLMSSGIRKFVILQDQSPRAEKFSDLDILDFEYSTAAVIYGKLQFPHREFELAQKSYYALLTYIMGLLEVFPIIFSERTDAIRKGHDTEFLWKDKEMSVRTVWLEKRLAAWAEIQDAALFCRDWRRLRPSLRMNAMMALKEWHKAEIMFSSCGENDIIDLTVISATGLPKSNFRLPAAWIKVVFYGSNRLGNPFRAFEYKSDVVQKTQNPVWGKCFQLRMPRDPKMIDVEVYDRIGGIDNLVAKARLPFGFVAGVEATLCNRSLMYGYNGKEE